ncbi:hypothetical protein D9611_000314 [Ephemerocybe angulata]|uniref:DUF6533 domain-containing protein n=1 Tax=Ephemerocybe angulata TaxID=980116 RepID=A0A8H5F6M5_9AGAR|nr:hypothetical protein D9611_000314 [Tulosesus angulatus]
MDSLASLPPAAQVAVMEAVVDGYTAILYTSYIATGGFALVVADYIHTFPDEVRLMWFAPLSVPKVLFFAVRYYVLVNNIFAALFVPGGVTTGFSPSECKSAFVRSAVSSPLVVVGAEVILFYRVYGFSGRSRWMLIYLVSQFIAIHVTSFIFLSRYLRSLAFIQWPFSRMSCMPFKADATLLGAVFAALLSSVIVAMLIMVFIAYRKHRGFNSALLQAFYRDGVVYFICLSALASANIGVSFAASSGYKYLFTQLEIDAHAILATRMLLHLRDVANRDTVAVMSSGLSSSNDRILMRPYTTQTVSSQMRFEKAPAFPSRGYEYD